MINYFYATDGYIKCGPAEDRQSRDKVLVWVDLLNPEAGEITEIDEIFDVDLPTQEEMREIEISSRMYEENNASYMTITYISNALGETPQTTQLTFVLKGDLLITMRYADMRIITHLIEKTASKNHMGLKTGSALLIYILENFIDLCADVLEKNHAEIEGLSRRIFDQSSGSKGYHLSLKSIAKIAELNSQIRESLVSLSRLNIFLGAALEKVRAPKEILAKSRTLATDASALLDHAAFVSGKITFLLDATLGLVNIEQNAIIKIFSVAAVIFLPPTLVASVYGMNFHHMPELQLPWGYPMAIGIMMISALLPFLYFKYKRWL
jgi:magnesium transporter